MVVNYSHANQDEEDSMALVRDKRIEEILEEDLSMLSPGSVTYERKFGEDMGLLGERSALKEPNGDTVRLLSSSSEGTLPGATNRVMNRVRDSRAKDLSASSLQTEPLLTMEEPNSDINSRKMSQTEQLESSAAQQQQHILHDEPESEPDGRDRRAGMSVRCHCNLASCVTNNYMCKSERRVTEDGKVVEAGCFVQELESESGNPHGVLMWNGRAANARRGCMEMLSREKQEQCSDRVGDQVHCCKDDMCNYPKSFYPSVIQNYNSNARASFDTSGHRGIAGMTPNLDHQVWLRAAVIAVPICGLMILVVLILVARRLLKSDDDYKDPDGRRYRHKFSNNSVPHHQPSLPHHHYQLTYHQPSARSTFNPDTNFHIKPVYVEPGSEFLLPPEPMCAHCQQPQVMRASSSVAYTHEESRKSNSEAEELVRSNGNNNCRCSGSSGGTESTCSGNLSDSESHGSHSFSWHSVPPLSVFSGSSPELPAVHRDQQGKESSKFSALSNIGRSRSTRSDTHTENDKPFDV